MSNALPVFLVLASLLGGSRVTPSRMETGPSADRAPRLGRALPELEPATVLNPRAEPWTSPHWKVVNYWHFYCSPCRAELPELERFAAANPDVEVLGVSFLFAPEEMPLREQLDHFRRVLLAKGVTYEVPLAARYRDLERFEFGMLPTTLLVDPAGRVVDEQRGGRGIREFLETAARSAQGEPEPVGTPAADTRGGRWFVVDPEEQSAVEGMIIHAVGFPGEPPELLRRAPMMAPADHLLARLGGVVIFATVIGPHGRIARAQTLKPIESPGLRREIVRSLRRWRFQPARWRGENCAVYLALSARVAPLGPGGASG